jgi:putative aminopeptidase
MIDDLRRLMMIPGLSGHEDRVRAAIAAMLDGIGLAHRTDRLGNLIATVPGDPAAPSVMVFTHMDQLGFVVRKVQDDGLIRIERVGGVPERALPAQTMVICTDQGDLPAVIGIKSHHATAADEKYTVIPYAGLTLDAGFASRAAAEAAGVRIGTPVTYAPRVIDLAQGRIAGTAIDDRAGCAVLVDLARRLVGRAGGPTVHLVWSVQEEFTLQGVVPAARTLSPDIALQIDLILATDTPGMEGRGDVTLGGGPAISLYSFHGRGTLNGVIPHPAIVRLVEAAAATAGIPLQRSVHTGALTDLSHVQTLGAGVACLDLGFPLRYTHTATEVVDTADLVALANLIEAALLRITPGFSLARP